MVAGTALADMVSLTAALFGLGALLAASATAFATLKIAGAAYLVWLGVKLWRSPPAPAAMAPPPTRSTLRMLVHAFLVAALNPKAVMFWVVFLPQFIDPAAPLVPQMLAMQGTVLVLGASSDSLYAVAAASLRRAIRRPSTQRVINRIGGGVLVGEGLIAAAARSI
jgi:threonine/homoserine/homoserine lactone efflux protein